MTTKHGIVVGADGSERGYAGVRYAALEAQRLGVALQVVHVEPAYLPVGTLPFVTDGTFTSYGNEVLTRAAATARETVPGLDVSTDLLSGARVPSLVERSRNARALVLAARHAGPVDVILSGATVVGATSRASCPVVVVPTSWQPAPPYGRVVVGFKSSKHATALFEAGFSLASDLGAELVVLHAWTLSGIYDDIIVARVDEGRWCDEQRLLIEALLEDYRTSSPDVSVRVEVVHRHPARALVEASRSADRLLIVKPSHGAALHHLGTTARDVLRHASCPVEVLPASSAGGGVPGLEIEHAGGLVR